MTTTLLGFFEPKKLLELHRLLRLLLLNILDRNLATGAYSRYRVIQAVNRGYKNTIKGLLTLKVRV